MAEAVTDILNYHNFMVDAVADGEEALAYARAGDYDGIILDIMLPKLSGLDVLRELREGDCRTPVRLAVVSTMMIAWLDVTRFWKTGRFTPKDRIQIAGLYSKQMEYSEENWAGLEEALLFDQAFEDALLQDLLCSL